jgi:hypothetical protein
LVRAPRAFLPVWKDVAAVAGLIPSIGKVYVHPTYLNINSTSYEWCPSTRTFRLIPYVNMGLVYGFQRSSIKKEATQLVDDVDERVGTIGARHRALMASSPYHLRVAVHKAYLEQNKAVLELFGSIPWYVSEEWGGVGLEPITDPAWDGDLDSPQYLYGPKPWEVAAVNDMRDYPHRYPMRHLPHDAPIQVRSTWTNLLPYRNVVGKSSYDLSEDDIGLLDVSAYYIAPSLVGRALKGYRLPVLRANQRTWLRLKRRFDRPSLVDSLVTSPEPSRPDDS